MQIEGSTLVVKGEVIPLSLSQELLGTRPPECELAYATTDFYLHELYSGQVMVELINPLPEGEAYYEWK